MKLKEIILSLTALFSVEATALTFPYGYNPDRHDIKSENFYLDDYDFSGIGKAGSRWVTAISPEWGIGAKHYPAGGTVTFNSGEQTTIDYVISPNSISDEDLILYHFNKPLQNTTVYDLIRFEEQEFSNMWESGVRLLIDDYLTLFYVGNSPNKTTQSVGMVTNWFDYRFDSGISNNLGFIDYAYGVSGDSGAPSFLPINNNLYIVGTHWKSKTDSSISLKIDEIVSLTNGSVKYNYYPDLLNNYPDVPEPNILPMFILGGLLGTNMRVKRE